MVTLWLALGTRKCLSLLRLAVDMDTLWLVLPLKKATSGNYLHRRGILANNYVSVYLEESSQIFLSVTHSIRIAFHGIGFSAAASVADVVAADTIDAVDNVVEAATVDNDVPVSASSLFMLVREPC